MKQTTEREADILDAETMVKALGFGWQKPEVHGEDSWMLHGPNRTIIISIDNYTEPGTPWIHASISYLAEGRIPSYSDMKQMHAVVFGDGHAYECFVPSAEHINIRANARHLWGRLDGKSVLPNFGREGTI